MLLITCPYCGQRPELEFSYAGEAHIDRPVRPADLNDEDWTTYLYTRSNPKGAHAERWRHLHGCGRFFNAIRDTRSDVFLATYKVGEQAPEVDYA
ncbi:sarcosine oxidase subunit delta [Sphingomonas melonis TY]|jgi:sarcosine oxidase, subunit delta|uniref:Sarcosine oxidase subunit delta n=2 Tax=Sphingomonas melonis TaxID=152682 RepID=A0A0D1K6S3_9SPHN|nr:MULTISPECIES: sarcosine oxidase subunit delta [Sphingomonas]MCI1143047.1 sarcosine oxidase subunit delta [Sphingomonas sp. WKB10]ANC85559.1 sarcosine oxidase subunit delta [Sphingomonas sp. NIC1]AOW23840.1 sarcosine oxidase subunit delta [Sphingomonas melonis TY]ATI54851.1 sarcosine oxidase subunit delta family protein [Sphingomonas melonis]KIU29323.1 sarcosine oxidase subunit delta [Sphingomonas melonis]